MTLLRLERRRSPATAAATCCRASTSRSLTGAIGCIVGPERRRQVDRAACGERAAAPARGTHPPRGRRTSPAATPAEILGLGHRPGAAVPRPVPEHHRARERADGRLHRSAATRRCCGSRYAEIAEMFAVVRERGDDKAGNLSGGQRRMVEVARSLMLDPRARPARRAVARPGPEGAQAGVRDRQELTDARQDRAARRAERPLRPAARDRRHRDGERARAADRARRRTCSTTPRWRPCTSAARCGAGPAAACRRRPPTGRPRLPAADRGGDRRACSPRASGSDSACSRPQRARAARRRGPVRLDARAGRRRPRSR